MDFSRQSVTKWLNDKKNAQFNKNKLFQRLNHVTDLLYEVEMLKLEIEHIELPFVGFFLQYAKQRVLELWYTFFRKFCVAEKYEEFQKDKDSLYLALSEENLETLFS